MEQILNEHGEMIISGLISIIAIMIIFLVIGILANINTWEMAELVG